MKSHIYSITKKLVRLPKHTFLRLCITAFMLISLPVGIGEKAEAANPEDLNYHKEHTWVKLSGEKVKIGVTNYYQDAIGDIVYIDLPKVGKIVERNTVVAEIESIMTTSPVISPVSGKIIEVNNMLEKKPEIINEDPYGKGWIVIIGINKSSELKDLMNSNEYENYLEHH